MILAILLVTKISVKYRLEQADTAVHWKYMIPLKCLLTTGLFVFHLCDE